MKRSAILPVLPALLLLFPDHPGCLHAEELGQSHPVTAPGLLWADSGAPGRESLRLSIPFMRGLLDSLICLFDGIIIY